MRIYTNVDVLTATKNRLKMIYENEKNVSVSVSGGKDSTVLLEIAIEVARELGKLPVIAKFVDQESEYDGTVEYMRYLQTRPEIDLKWFQIPFVLTNSTSLDGDNYLHCWKPGEKWMRDKEPNSIHENPVKDTRFHKVMTSVTDWMFNGEEHFVMIGIRASESMVREKLMSKTIPAYKNVYWASKAGNGYNMYPIYDWETKDIWKYIAENDVVYNKVYDNMYRAGVRRNNMRVSSLIHETGHWALGMLHEIEPETYSKLSTRVDGVSDYHTGGIELFVPKKLPIAFKSWVEYRDYLLENIVDEKHQPTFKKWFNDDDDEDLARSHVSSIVLNDYEGVRLADANAARDNIRFKSQSSKQRKMGKDRASRSK